MKITIVGCTGNTKTVVIESDRVKNLVVDFYNDEVNLVADDYSLRTYSGYGICDDGDETL